MEVFLVMNEPQYSAAYVILLGMATVFIGLIFLICICKIMGLVCQKLGAGKNNEPAASAPVPAANAVIPNKSELIAAVGAAIAEDLGTDVSGIRIHSIKKI